VEVEVVDGGVGEVDGGLEEISLFAVLGLGLRLTITDAV
jgi:hypothetical protein